MFISLLCSLRYTWLWNDDDDGVDDDGSGGGGCGGDCDDDDDDDDDCCGGDCDDVDYDDAIENFLKQKPVETLSYNPMFTRLNARRTFM